jgi:hypothetical protein
LRCHLLETQFGEKWLIDPQSVNKHIAYIKEVALIPTSRDKSRYAATTVTPENKGDSAEQGASTSADQSRPVAIISDTDERYIVRLEGEVEFLRGQIATKDAQIKELTERNRETNLLIAGLQKMLAPLLSRSANSRE